MAGGILGSIIGAALPGVLPSITDTAKILVDRLVPDPAAKAQAQKDIEEAITARVAVAIDAVKAQDAAQGAVNLAEAQGNDRYSSRWRPTVGWICTAGLGYQFLFAPVMTWVGGIVGVALDVSFPAPPTLITTDLMPLLYALLGIGAMRTVERVSGVSVSVPQTK